MDATAELERLRAANRVRGARWRERHPEKYLATARAYATRRRASGWRPVPFTSVFYNARRGVRRYGLPIGNLTKLQVMRIVLLPCFSCGQLPAGGMDHIYPLSRGGANDLENVQPACLDCNRRKQATVAA